MIDTSSHIIEQNFFTISQQSSKESPHKLNIGDMSFIRFLRENDRLCDLSFILIFRIKDKDIITIIFENNSNKMHMPPLVLIEPMCS